MSGRDVTRKATDTGCHGGQLLLLYDVNSGVGGVGVSITNTGLSVFLQKVRWTSYEREGC